MQPISTWLTLYYNIRSGVDGVHVVTCEAGVLSPIGLINVLNIETSWRSDVDARVHREGRVVSFGPGHTGLWLARRTALQGHALPDQNLCILRLDHETRSSWREKYLQLVASKQTAVCKKQKYYY